MAGHAENGTVSCHEDPDFSDVRRFAPGHTMAFYWCGWQSRADRRYSSVFPVYLNLRTPNPGVDVLWSQAIASCGCADQASKLKGLYLRIALNHPARRQYAQPPRTQIPTHCTPFPETVACAFSFCSVSAEKAVISDAEKAPTLGVSWEPVAGSGSRRHGRHYPMHFGCP